MLHSLKRTLVTLAAAVTATLAVQSVSAQYYSWGADPARFRWMRESDSLSDVIYPRHAAAIGASTAYFVRRMHPYISYGYRLPALDLPFIVHPENMQSNGLVMWLPKRVEFLTAPARRRLLDAVDKTARGARVPPRPCSTTTSTWAW